MRSSRSRSANAAGAPGCFKLEASLAVQSTTLPRFFPTNKFSAAPSLIGAARLASAEADGIGGAADARKRLMIVPNGHVQELITEAQPDNWVRVTGVRVWQNGALIDILVAPSRNDRQSAVALTTLQAIAGGPRGGSHGHEPDRPSAIEPHDPRAESSDRGQPAAYGDPEPSMFYVAREGQSPQWPDVSLPDHSGRIEQTPYGLRGGAFQEAPDARADTPACQ